MKLHLKHILLSHHGEYQFGSPKIPQTSEAMLVHLIDLTDSKMNTFASIKRTDTQRADWSGYVKHLDRMIYKTPLPHFVQPLPDKFPEKSSKNKNKNLATKKAPLTPPSERPLKQNLGMLLKDFKLERG